MRPGLCAACFAKPTYCALSVSIGFGGHNACVAFKRRISLLFLQISYNDNTNKWQGVTMEYNDINSCASDEGDGADVLSIQTAKPVKWNEAKSICA